MVKTVNVQPAGEIMESDWFGLWPFVLFFLFVFFFLIIIVILCCRPHDPDPPPCDSPGSGHQR